MAKINAPKSIRMTFLWIGLIVLCYAASLEVRYREGSKQLPTLVDAQGHTASIEEAIAGLDKYEHLKNGRRLAILLFIVGSGLGLFVVITTNQQVERKSD
jgi:hypothetical protein